MAEHGESEALGRRELAERIRAYASDAGASDEAFDALALDCLRAQATQVNELMGWSEALASEPQGKWSGLPPFPAAQLTAQGPCWGTVEAEFHAEPPQMSKVEDPEASAAEPLSAIRRCQPLLDLERDLLDVQVLSRQLLGVGDEEVAARPAVLILCPPRMLAPHDEAAFLAEHLAERWSGAGTSYAAGAGGLHSSKARQRLQDQADGSIWLLGSQIALHDLCVELERHGQQLPAGAVAGVVTLAGIGPEQPSEDELMARAATQLGLGPERLHVLLDHPALSSVPQRRGDDPSGEFICPKWLRAAVIDDEGTVCRDVGAEGRLAFLDLANLGSACWVATGTRGRLGEASRFVLAGSASSVN